MLMGNNTFSLFCIEQHMRGSLYVYTSHKTFVCLKFGSNILEPQGCQIIPFLIDSNKTKLISSRKKRLCITCISNFDTRTNTLTLSEESKNPFHKYKAGSSL